VRERVCEVVEAYPSAKDHRTIGNHDQRFESKLANFVPGMCLKDHLPEWTESMSLMVSGNVMIKHRFANGIHATYNNVLKSGTSIVKGHLHALQV
jgi:hypothetical protein